LRQHRILKKHKIPDVDIVGTFMTCLHNHSVHHMEQGARPVASGTIGVRCVVLAKRPSPAVDKPNVLAKNASKDKVYMPWIPLNQMMTHQREPHQVLPNCTFTPCV